MNRCRWFVCVSRNWKLEDTYNIKIGNKCVGCLPTKTTEYQAVNGGGDSEVGGGGGGCSPRTSRRHGEPHWRLP
jgi:hypothetical protein